MTVTSLSDSQIVKGQFSQQQVADLEKRLIEVFFARAKAQGKKVEFETDVKEYLRKKDEGKVFDGEAFVLLTDESKGIIDITPVVYHCLDTDEGLQYAKIMQRREYLPPSERPASSSQ